jgi:periplasmic divalent cation tolerance protein
MNTVPQSLRLIMTTFADESEAEPIVRQLLQERLIACGTLLPGARSLYHWKGVVEEASEIVVLFKTDEAHSSDCMARLTVLHPYEVPEIILLTPEAVAAPYVAWIRDSLRKLD